MPRTSIFSRLNQTLRGKFAIDAYNTPVLWDTPSNGWNQSRFTIKPRCESALSLLKNSSESSANSSSLNFF